MRWPGQGRADPASASSAPARAASGWRSSATQHLRLLRRAHGICRGLIALAAPLLYKPRGIAAAALQGPHTRKGRKLRADHPMELPASPPLRRAYEWRLASRSSSSAM